MNVRSIFCLSTKNFLAFIFGIMLIVGSSYLGLAQDNSGFVPPQELDGSRLKGAQKPSANPALPSGQVSQQKVFDQLYKELDNLIPGKFEDGSPQKKAIEDAITAFQLRDANRVVEILDKAGAADPNFPPTDLLLAGLSFTVKDAKSGRVLLERAAIQHPNSPAVYSAFSRLAINENRYTDGLALLEKMANVIKESKVTGEAKEFYQINYFDGMIDVAMRQQRLDDARRLLAAQRARLPGNPKVLMVSAELEFKEKKYDDAMKFLTELRAAFPPTRAPESIMASWFQRTSQNEEAKKWLSVAASKYPKDAQVQLEVASLALNDEDFPAASAAIKLAESNSRETPFSKNLKAKIAFARQSFVIAESHYAALIKMQPDNFDAANMYALCLSESPDEAKRKQALNLALRNFRSLPNNLVAQSSLGYIQLRMGDPNAAKSALIRAAQTSGTSPEVDYFVASLLKELKETDKAKEIITKALQHKGLFLYRQSAKKMLAELGSSELPTPKVGNPLDGN
ncbi:MAG: tetratricopeptide repeat protein [Mariniblastus sp.]